VNREEGEGSNKPWWITLVLQRRDLIAISLCSGDEELRAKREWREVAEGLRDTNKVV